jgi:hypothetical protein
MAGNHRISPSSSNEGIPDMRKRSNTISRVTRKVPENTFTQTILGKREQTTFNCKCCYEKLLIGESYLESKSKRKHDNQIRGICVFCWDLTNGRVKQKEKSDASLMEFLNT